MSKIIETLLAERRDAQIRREPLECFLLNQDDYCELLCDSSLVVDPDPRPTPPIEAEASWHSSSLFGGSSGHYEKRDHHAPEYLQALSDWEQRMAKPDRDKRPRIFGIPIELI